MPLTLPTEITFFASGITVERTLPLLRPGMMITVANRRVRVETRTVEGSTEQPLRQRATVLEIGGHG